VLFFLPALQKIVWVSGYSEEEEEEGRKKERKKERKCINKLNYENHLYKIVGLVA
jgi:hypothetical protein